MIDVYYIGGSPCSGKSTVAEIIAKNYGFHYFKADDYLERYTIKGAKMHYPICTKQNQMSTEQIWMRDSTLQCKEEFQYYRELSEFIQADLINYPGEKTIIAEGAAYLPELMNQHNITKDRYIAITPTKEFQISRYREREWVSYFLEGCSDKEKAFANWMDRDVQFAQEVRRQCQEMNYSSILIDGTIAIDQIVSMVCASFGLEI